MGPANTVKRVTTPIEPKNEERLDWLCENAIPDEEEKENEPSRET